MLPLLISFAISAAVAVFAYSRSRAFVSERLRYVDAVNHPLAPIAAGVGAALVAAPVAAMLPLVSAGTALTFGLAVGFGVAAGRSGESRRLPP
ncbi:MAG TPA: hypothetical protein VF981_00705 [Gemmatimonadaceae bacterium]